MLKVKYNNEYFNIDDGLNVCIFSDDINLSFELLKEIAGINNSEVIFDSNYVFDNEDYFKYRLFIDNNKRYINTLASSIISREVLNKFNKAFNEEDFERLVKKTKIRFLDNFENRERFDSSGNTILNNIFALSMYNYRIVHDVFLNLVDREIINILKEEYNNKKGNLFSSSLKQISIFKGFLDKIVIINKKVFIFNKDSNILRFESCVDNMEDELVYSNNKYFYYKCDLLRSDEFNQLIKKKKFKMVSIYDIGEDNE